MEANGIQVESSRSLSQLFLSLRSLLEQHVSWSHSFRLRYYDVACFRSTAVKAWRDATTKVLETGLIQNLTLLHFFRFLRQKLYWKGKSSRDVGPPISPLIHDVRLVPSLNSKIPEFFWGMFTAPDKIRILSGLGDITRDQDCYIPPLQLEQCWRIYGRVIVKCNQDGLWRCRTDCFTGIRNFVSTLCIFHFFKKLVFLGPT